MVNKLPVLALAAGLATTAIIWLDDSEPEAPFKPKDTAGATAISPPVSSLVIGLEDRLRENPDDGKGWLLLARSYDHLGDPVKSLDAYREAAAHGVQDQDFEKKLLSGYFSSSLQAHPDSIGRSPHDD